MFGASVFQYHRGKILIYHGIFEDLVVSHGLIVNLVLEN